MKDFFNLVGITILILWGVFEISEPLKKNDDLINDYVEILLNENKELNLKDFFLNRLEEDLIYTDFDLTTLNYSLQMLDNIQDYSVETFVIWADFLEKSKAYSFIISTPPKSNEEQFIAEFYVRTKQVNGYPKVEYISGKHYFR